MWALRGFHLDVVGEDSNQVVCVIRGLEGDYVALELKRAVQVDVVADHGEDLNMRDEATREIPSMMKPGLLVNIWMGVVDGGADVREGEAMRATHQARWCDYY